MTPHEETYLATAPTRDEPAQEPPSGKVDARGSNPEFLAGRAPQWRPGQSGNPSGLTKDGRSTRDLTLERTLLGLLKKPGKTEKLVTSWYRMACKGSAPHLEMILKRLYPVVESERGAQIIEQGIVLETDGKGLKLTIAQRGKDSPDSTGFAVHESSESQSGAPAGRLCELQPAPGNEPLVKESLSEEELRLIERKRAFEEALRESQESPESSPGG